MVSRGFHVNPSLLQHVCWSLREMSWVDFGGSQFTTAKTLWTQAAACIYRPAKMLLNFDALLHTGMHTSPTSTPAVSSLAARIQYVVRCSRGILFPLLLVSRCTHSRRILMQVHVKSDFGNDCPFFGPMDFLTLGNMCMSQLGGALCMSPERVP